MRNFVRKNMHLTCRANIQQSKRRQALMAASVQDGAEVLFEGEILLDSEDGLWDDTLSDLSCSSISIGDEE